MTYFDALSNWIQLKLVADARPDDEAAVISLEHVTKILTEEYKVIPRSSEKVDDQYIVTYTEEGVEKKQAYPSQVAETLLQFINEDPKRFEFK